MKKLSGHPKRKIIALSSRKRPKRADPLASSSRKTQIPDYSSTLRILLHLCSSDMYGSNKREYIKAWTQWLLEERGGRKYV